MTRESACNIEEGFEVPVLFNIPVCRMIVHSSYHACVKYISFVCRISLSTWEYAGQALIKEHMEHSQRLCAHLPPWWKTGEKPSLSSGAW